MPVNKDALKRYRIIDRLLSDPNRDYTTDRILKEVNQECEQVSIRMIQKDIKALEEENKSRKEEIEELKKRIGEGDDHFTELEKTNKVILRTLQALLNLSLGVSDTEALKKVSEDLNDFILNK